jgi:FKBP-type peptidyl-prolyl cis-trans isomerase
MKLVLSNIAALLFATTPAFAQEQPDGEQLGKALHEAMSSTMPGTPEERQKALEDLTTVWVSGPKECDKEKTIDAQMFVSVEYEGRIAEESATGVKGEVFDSSALRGQPLEFQHSLGQVPMGFDFGTHYLCEGTNATITIPPLLAFGEQGNGGKIPGNATIVFSVLVKKVAKEDWRTPYDYYTNMDVNRDGLVTREEMTDFMLNYYRAGVPDELWAAADKNGDGFSDWDEFPFSKGARPEIKEHVNEVESEKEEVVESEKEEVAESEKEEEVESEKEEVVESEKEEEIKIAEE